MKAYEILKNGFRLDGGDIDAFNEKDTALTWLNRGIMWAMGAEKILRKEKGELPAEFVPVGRLDQNVDMDFKICSMALPRAVASMAAFDRQDAYMGENWRREFTSALSRIVIAKEESIEDMYKGGEA